MLFDFMSAELGIGDDLILRDRRWGVDSEFGRLTDVMLAAPRHLELVPCNAVSIENRNNGLSSCPEKAGEQHGGLVAALERHGVRCHLVPPVAGMPDLSFTRDSTLMTPWGLLALNPAVPHRMAEAEHVRAVARGWGVPLLGRVPEGRIEGGDVCLLRPGVVVIGNSGERTDRRGADALAGIFEARGWRTIRYGFDPHFLHLDTHFTMIDRDTALACVDALDPRFLAELEALGIALIPATREEVRRLGANILSLGDGRILSSSDNVRINDVVERRGYTVVPVDIGQFAACGGGIHCLTMPLARMPG